MRRAPFLLLLTALSSCTCAPRPPTVTRTLLARLPDSIASGTVALSEDERDLAYGDQTPQGVRVMHAGTAGPPYSGVLQVRLAPHTDGLFYWAGTEQDGTLQTFLIANGTAMPIVPPITRPLPFVFSANGTRWAAVAASAPLSEGVAGTVRMWLDGQLAGEFADMTQPAFSADGAHVAALTDGGGGRINLVVDGRPQRVFEAPAQPAAPRISGQSAGPAMPEQFVISYMVNGELLLLTTDRDGWSVYRGDQRLATYPGNRPRGNGTVEIELGGALADAPAIASDSLVAASGAPAAAWWARDGGSPARWRVVLEARPQLPSCGRTADAPALSADGRHLAYTCYEAPADQSSKASVHHDTRHFGPFNDVWGVTISADGNHVAFAADNGAETRPWFYVVDGRRYGLRFDQAFPPRFSRNGAHVAWVAKRERGDRPARYILFLDGSSIASSDEVVGAPRFADDGNLSWVLRRGKRLSRIEVKL